MEEEDIAKAEEAELRTGLRNISFKEPEILGEDIPKSIFDGISFGKAQRGEKYCTNNKWKPTLCGNFVKYVF